MEEVRIRAAAVARADEAEMRSNIVDLVKVGLDSLIDARISALKSCPVHMKLAMTGHGLSEVENGFDFPWEYPSECGRIMQTGGRTKGCRFGI